MSGNGTRSGRSPEELGPPGPTEYEPFRLIDWGTDGLVTIETSVGHLPRKSRAALLDALNVFVAALNGDRPENLEAQTSGGVAK